MKIQNNNTVIFGTVGVGIAWSIVNYTVIFRTVGVGIAWSIVNSLNLHLERRLRSAIFGSVQLPVSLIRFGVSIYRALHITIDTC